MKIEKGKITEAKWYEIGTIIMIILCIVLAIILMARHNQVTNVVDPISFTESCNNYSVIATALDPISNAIGNTKGVESYCVYEKGGEIHADVLYRTDTGTELMTIIYGYNNETKSVEIFQKDIYTSADGLRFGIS